MSESSSKKNDADVNNSTAPVAGPSNARNTFYMVLIAIIALVFIFNWGPGAKGCTGGGDDIKVEENIATVNGKPIKLREFAEAYEREMQPLRAQNIPAEFLKQFGIDKRAMDRVVNSELLAQAAESRGLSASADDVRKILKTAPAFQKDGKFDKGQYSSYVSSMNLTVVQFEDKLRRELAAQKLLQLVESSVVVSEEEVKTRYLKDADSADATVVKFSTDQFKDKVATPKKNELEAFAKNGSDAIAAFYEKNKFKYLLQEKVKARQILLKVAPDATDAQKLEVKTRAENVRKDIVDNKKDFSEVAKQFSEDLATKEKGGDLGFVERTDISTAFANALFAIGAKEVTAAIETPAGFLIGQVEEKKAPEQRSLDSVKTEIVSELFINDKAKVLAKAAAEAGLAEMKKGKTLADLFPADEKAKDNSMNFGVDAKPVAKKTGSFTKSALSIPNLGEVASLQKQLFEKTAPGMVESVVELTEGFALVNLDERKMATDERFETEKAQLKIETLKAKQYEAREAFVKGLKQSATIVENDAAKKRVVGGEG
jgi:peptidyl-prolyl cis-trans isomerase D